MCKANNENVSQTPSVFEIFNASFRKFGDSVLKILSHGAEYKQHGMLYHYTSLKALQEMIEIQDESILDFFKCETTARPAFKDVLKLGSLGGEPEFAAYAIELLMRKESKNPPDSIRITKSVIEVR